MSVLNRLVPYAGLRVLISGGAAGIGEVLAAAYLEAGAKVHVCDVSEAAIAAFLDRHPGSVATHADVADPAQIEAVFRVQRARFDGLD
ncbi:SDR family NAD(P)-dependent oxidoreductase, partial [Pseudomonas syringae]